MIFAPAASLALIEKFSAAFIQRGDRVMTSGHAGIRRCALRGKPHYSRPEPEGTPPFAIHPRAVSSQHGLFELAARFGTSNVDLNDQPVRQRQRNGDRFERQTARFADVMVEDGRNGEADLGIQSRRQNLKRGEALMRQIVSECSNPIDKPTDRSLSARFHRAGRPKDACGCVPRWRNW